MIKNTSRKTLTVKEAASWLGISRQSAYQAVREGSIPSLRLGRRIVIPVHALEAMLAGSVLTTPISIAN